ncbi:hypothetical protein IFM89_015491 [Coptis chinensis]|uniref:Nudix hydrolase domain-containing protein n=1 Tax=Coptis chinensis TaxID=261450 RepID=A0A835GWM2_9MAGN|nr:hypothetical protein IFM89_015491 [Coptis chinensis]
MPHPFNPTSLCLPDLFVTSLSLLFLFSSTTKPHKNLFLKIPNNFPRCCCRPFLKIPNMPPTKSRFPTPQSLTNWLKPRLPQDSFSSWGNKPGTKNIHNLFLEISEGESILTDTTPPIRNLHVITVKIISKSNSNCVLIEAFQELSDGTRRERFRPLSEKMKPNESVENAVLRAVKEELGSVITSEDDGNVKIVEGSYVEKVEERGSVSYPGLPACYVLHCVEACVDGLPSEDFWTEEGNEYGECSEGDIVEKAVFVKKHFWKWVGVNSLN